MPVKAIGFLCLLLAGTHVQAECPGIPAPLTAQLLPGQIVLIGEIHGTAQMPKRFADVICHARQNQTTVKIGLELPDESATGLASWLDSDGSAEAKRQLASRPFWLDDYQDGRASKAMFALLVDLHRYRNDVEVFAFDRQTSGRDYAMAMRILEETTDNTLTLVLTGNIHSQTHVGTPWDPTFETMGSVILARHSRTVGIRFRHGGGSAWVCAPECGERRLAGDAATPAKVFTKSSGPHDFDWWIGTIDVSMPLVTN
ncbi:MAG: hypothetical protein AB8G17_01110 [Gammaproteobacteria bacterium]